VVGHDRRRQREPEDRHPRQDLALARDQRRVDRVVGRDPVGGDHQDPPVEVVVVADLARADQREVCERGMDGNLADGGRYALVRAAAPGRNVARRCVSAAQQQPRGSIWGFTGLCYGVAHADRRARPSQRTAQVIDAVKAGERVTLTVHGEPVADIVRTAGARGGWSARSYANSCGRVRPIRSCRECSTNSPADPRRGVNGASAGLLDTSVFIAREGGRPLGGLPDHVAVSVVTIGELQLGVLHAADDQPSAPRRAETLALARMADPIPMARRSW